MGEKRYSIITDYLGTPTQMFDEQGELSWEADYDIYGKIRKLHVGSLGDCPFRYQGQYEDVETGLYYNRFRYYSPDTGTYVSQDPIGLAGEMPNFYSYIRDCNGFVDPFGLAAIFDEGLAKIARQAHDVLRDANGEPTRAFNNSTVSVAEVSVDGKKQLFASGNGASLRPAQREKLVELGVPTDNIFSGQRFKKTIDGDKVATNLANHAERVIINNVPDDAIFTGKWGVSWAGKQRNASCANCQPHVDRVSINCK